MSSDDTTAGSESPPADRLAKDNARLARRVSRLEATLEHVEQIRDTNARLLDKLTGELEAEPARSASTCSSTSCRSRSSIASTPASSSIRGPL